MTFKQWKAEASRLLLRTYLIDLADAGAPAEILKRFWAGGESPAEYVEYLGRKFDLVEHKPHRLGA